MLPRLSPYLVTLTLLVPSALADVLVIQPSKDNTIYEEATGNSNGSGDHFFSGRTATGRTRRSLLAFDVASALPPGSTVNSVSLTLHMSMTIASSRPVGLYTMTGDWGEGASDAPGMEGGGGPAAAGDATWLTSFFPSLTWTTDGGDYQGTARASTSVGGNGFYTWSSPDITADVQEWLDAPAGNFGWLVRHVNESGNATAKRFDSRSHPTAAWRPALTIDFDPPSGGCVASNFCSSTANSTGSPAVIGFTGSCVAADNALTLTAGPVPDQPGIFFYSAAQASGGAGVPFGNGLRCVGGGAQIYRLSVSFAAGNQLSFTPDLTAPPSATGLITAGSTWNFQAWYRDPVAGGAGFDLSDGLELTFQ